MKLPTVTPLSDIELAQMTAKLLSKPILYLSGLFDEDRVTDIDSSGNLSAAPFIPSLSQSWADGFCFIVCESEDEMMDLYNLVYGDDGLNKEVRDKYNIPHYTGKHRVYALTIHSDGTLGTENT